MVKINAFNGITYNKENFDSLKDLLAPPYDVISPAYQQDLYNKSPYNVIRLILGKVYDTDNDQNNRYTRTAEDYSKWLNENVLVKSDKPKIYYYVQKYQDTKGKDVVRKGFIALCYLEEFSTGKVLPHEETMGGPKKDRFGVMKATKANFSQIFSIYSDPEKQIENLLDNYCKNEPFADVIDDYGVRHIFYEVSDKDIIEKVKAVMADKSVLIADGHHRYETALQYKKFRSEEDKSDSNDEKAYNYMMMYFANLDEEGLRVYPTHRMLKKAVNISLNELKSKLDPYFTMEIKEFNNFEDCFNHMEKEDLSELPIGLVSKEDPGKLYILKPIMEKVRAQLLEKNVPELLAKLDVAILHRVILEGLLDLDTVELKNQSNIEFIRDEKELSDKYNSNQAELMFLLSTPDVATIKEICLSGLRMPQKTTYFYPKLLSGLVINSLE